VTDLSLASPAQVAQSPAVRSQPRPSSLGQILPCLVLHLAIITVGLLAAAPAWHEYLHHDAASNHVCAVSFFASGHCEAAVASTPSVAPAQAPIGGVLFFSHAPALPKAHFFGRLEHAPPAFA
jgi:hypothetical protein